MKPCQKSMAKDAAPREALILSRTFLLRPSLLSLLVVSGRSSPIAWPTRRYAPSSALDFGVVSSRKAQVEEPSALEWRARILKEPSSVTLRVPAALPSRSHGKGYESCICQAVDAALTVAAASIFFESWAAATLCSGWFYFKLGGEGCNELAAARRTQCKP